jgi:hypothetical protein
MNCTLAVLLCNGLYCGSASWLHPGDMYTAKDTEVTTGDQTLQRWNLFRNLFLSYMQAQHSLHPSSQSSVNESSVFLKFRLV